MKKAFVIIGVIFGGILLVAVLSVVGILFCMGSPVAGIVMSLMLLVVAAVILNSLRIKLNRAFGIHSAVFVCCATLPALALDAARYLVFNQIGGTDNVDIFAFLFMLAEAITAPILLVLLLIVMLITHLINKSGGKSSSATETKEEV